MLCLRIPYGSPSNRFHATGYVGAWNKGAGLN